MSDNATKFKNIHEENRMIIWKPLLTASLDKPICDNA